MPNNEVFHIFKILGLEFDVDRQSFRSRFTMRCQPLKMELQSFTHHRGHLLKGVAGGDTTGDIGRMAGEVAADAFSKDDQVISFHFNPACLRMLATFSFERSLLPWKGTVVVPGFSGCSNCMWLPFCRTSFHPSFSSIRMISRAFNDPSSC